MGGPGKCYHLAALLKLHDPDAFAGPGADANGIGLNADNDAVFGNEDHIVVLGVYHLDSGHIAKFFGVVVPQALAAPLLQPVVFRA